jgi:predicted branched-subunit amino acid permease
MTVPDIWIAERAAVRRAALGVGIATGAYGLSFGAISVAAGLSTLQTCVLSLFLFSGGSQFALVGILGAGGGAVSAAATAVLLGSRNAFYGLRLATLLDVTGIKRAAAAQIVIDESTAVATAQKTPQGQRYGFWATGIAVFVLWNLATLLGALGAAALADPRTFGFDAASSAAFVALLAPRMRSREPWVIGLLAAGVAIAAVPFVPIGVPVLFAAVVAIVAGVGRRDPASDQKAAE